MTMNKKGSGFPGSRTTSRGNGNLPINDPRFLEGMFSPQAFPNPLKELTHPGKDPKELLMRCVFKDERERNAAVLYLAKCDEFGLKVEKEVLVSWLASTASVRGLARRELLMGHTGIIAPTLYPDIRLFGKDRREREAKEEVK